MTPIAAWQNFYVIVGSSAGGLIGLQFVAMSLIANLPRRADAQAGAAFGTPTVIHLGAVLGLSALLCAPWDNPHAAGVAWGVAGLVGVIYAALVTRRMRRQTAYKPEFEDWLFHALLPFAAYAALAGSGYAARLHLREAMFVVGAAVLVLLYTGIHNAWDALTYHVFVVRPGVPPPPQDTEGAPPSR